MSSASHVIVVPRLPHTLSQAETQLFESRLGSSQDAIAALLLALRVQVDAELAPRLPTFGAKPYPLGRCREIRDGVFTRLDALLQQRPAGPHAAILQALRQYVAGGGICRKIWGSLRDDYFQNALQLGTWYVDVANDTVIATKPKLELLPLAASGFVRVRDYRHFADIAAHYWQVSVYANTVFPRLAPLFPLICAAPEGRVWLAAAYDEMIELTRSEHFLPSERIVGQLAPPPPAVRTQLLTCAARANCAELALDGDAVEACRAARAAALMYSPAYRETLVRAWLLLKQQAEAGTRAHSGVG